MSCTLSSTVNATSNASTTLDLSANFSSSLNAEKNGNLSSATNAYFQIPIHIGILKEQFRNPSIGLDAEAGDVNFTICGRGIPGANPILTVDLTNITMDNAILTIDSSQ